MPNALEMYCNLLTNSFNTKCIHKMYIFLLLHDTHACVGMCTHTNIHRHITEQTCFDPLIL